MNEHNTNLHCVLNFAINEGVEIHSFRSHIRDNYGGAGVEKHAQNVDYFASDFIQIRSEEFLI